MSEQPVPVRSRTASHRIGIAYLVLSVVLVPWTVWLAWTLPPESVAHHYDVAWPGFDVMLLAGLGTTGWCALRRSPYLPVAASATGALLVVDAWFDVTTAGARDRWVSLGLAVAVELPLAAMCLWLALHGQETLAEQATRPQRRWRVSRSAGTAAAGRRTPRPPRQRA